MTQNLAFDIYGTLIDPQGIATSLDMYIGSRAGTFAKLWREKQLEYTFRKGLMSDYEDFSICTSQALDYTCEFLDCNLSVNERSALLELYQKLPCFDDTASALASLKKQGHRLFAFSNGLPSHLNSLLVNAGILDFFDDIVSVDGVKTFKPSPVVYQHFLNKTSSSKGDTWLVSSNSFDIIGAASSGWNTVWVNRNSQLVFDPWKLEPSVSINNLSELSSRVFDER